MTSTSATPAATAGDTERLLGMVMALAGEVFLLKAEVTRLRSALVASGATDEAQLADVVRGDAWKAWMQTEENAFTASILRPFIQPDLVPDVSHLLEQRT